MLCFLNPWIVVSVCPYVSRNLSTALILCYCHSEYAVVINFARTVQFPALSCFSGLVVLLCLSIMAAGIHHRVFFLQTISIMKRQVHKFKFMLTFVTLSASFGLCVTCKGGFFLFLFPLQKCFHVWEHIVLGRIEPIMLIFLPIILFCTSC